MVKFGAQHYTHLLAAPVPTAFTDHGQVWCSRYPRSICLHAKFYPDRFIASPLRGNKTEFYSIFNFNFLWWRHLAARDKVEHGCTNTNLPMSKPCTSKRFDGEIVSTNSTGHTKNKIYRIFSPLPTSAREVRVSHLTRHGDKGGPYALLHL